ncbi:MAG: hypothetical protein WAQ74_07355 [Kiritimatiellia bacterium]|jgi:hypothetical protein|nr:hypothetical protein [Lentisphaerota bacterium]
MKTLCRLLAALFLLALMPGCASTPAQRIAQNQELFDSFPVADQARIRGGQIDLGYSPDMVRIALGTPQQRYIRRITGGNTREIWIYLATQSRYERQRADIDGLTVSGPGGTRSVGGSAWISVWQERDFIRYRIEFHNGAVVAIEEPAPEENKK